MIKTEANIKGLFDNYNIINIKGIYYINYYIIK